MAIDIRPRKVERTKTGYKVVYQVFETADPDTVLNEVVIEGATVKQIAANLARKYMTFKARQDEQATLLGYASQAIVQAKAIIAGG